MFGAQTDSAVPRLMDLLQRRIYPRLKPMDRPTKLRCQTLLVLINKGKFDGSNDRLLTERSQRPKVGLWPTREMAEGQL
jgi:hypothetical protein